MTYRPAFLKPEPYRKAKARSDREEARVKRAVRAEVARRDGYCRLRGGPFGPCAGPSTWNHLTRRSATVNRAPEERHSTRESLMACRHHHRLMDEHVIAWRYLTARQADGPMAFAQGEKKFEG